MTYDKPLGGIYCCMCKECNPEKERTSNGDYYFCKNCGLQLTFKQVDNLK